MNALQTQRIKIFIQYQALRLASKDTTIVKRALQALTTLLRGQGLSLFDPVTKRSMEVSLLGLLHKFHDHPKLLMWTLNVLAYVGTPTNTASAIVDCVSANENEAPVVAAGIAALQKMRGEDALKSITNMASAQLTMLASLQHLPPRAVDVESARLKVDCAGPEMLKLALVLVGTDKAPPNLFDPNFDNPEIVKELASHDDEIVMQYSCWATAENPNLGYSHLGIPMKDLQDQPPSVRAWMYQVLCKDGPRNRTTLEIIEEGCRDLSERARAGLSNGLREFHLDGIEPFILDWYGQTESAEIRQNLQYHMAAHGEEVPQYASAAIDAFQSSPPASAERTNLLSAATGTVLYREMKAIEAKGDPGLFPLDQITTGGISLVKQEFNFGDNTQIGALSGTGNSTNNGPQSINDVESLMRAIVQLQSEIPRSSLNNDQKQELLDLIKQAEKSPSRSVFSSISGFVKKIDAVVKSAVASGEAWAKLLVLVSQAGVSLY